LLASGEAFFHAPESCALGPVCALRRVTQSEDPDDAGAPCRDSTPPSGCRPDDLPTAPPSLDPPPCGGLSEGEGAAEIHILDSVRLRRGHLESELEGADPGVVGQAIHSPPAPHRSLDHRIRRAHLTGPGAQRP